MALPAIYTRIVSGVCQKKNYGVESGNE